MKVVKYGKNPYPLPKAFSQAICKTCGTLHETDGRECFSTTWEKGKAVHSLPCLMCGDALRTWTQSRIIP